MEWVKLYTTFHDHRKTCELTCTEVGLWTLCLSWSGAQDTDGFVPRRIALRFLGGEDGDMVIGRLLRSGLWEQVGGGYQMHAWQERQMTAEERSDLRRRRAEAGRLGGMRKAANRAAAAGGRERDTEDPSNRLAPARQEPQHVPGTRLAHAQQTPWQTGSRVEESTKRRPDGLPPFPPPHRGGGEVVVLSPDHGFLPREDEADDFAQIYAKAYRETHGGHDPSGLLMREVVSAAGVCQREGIALDHIRRAVTVCARSNGTKEWEFVQALAEVQGGERRASAKNPIDAQIEDLLRRAGSQV